MEKKKTKEKLKVVKGHFIFLKKGEVKISCEMSDGSRWTCDKDGKNWKCEKPSDESLSKSFNDFIEANPHPLTNV